MQGEQTCSLLKLCRCQTLTRPLRMMTAPLRKREGKGTKPTGVRKVRMEPCMALPAAAAHLALLHRLQEQLKTSEEPVDVYLSEFDINK